MATSLQYDFRLQKRKTTYSHQWMLMKYHFKKKEKGDKIMSNYIEEKELGWDDEIENDGPEFTFYSPAGDYDFEVTGLERE